ncbi:hypothetical protein Tfer_2819 [Thermincola ferriacetica]|uniref:DUF4363 domain-containing protein n=2 Tax=Thermincola TaxID=278993 RepID=D5XAK5_THEPJ|nr:MULTISPECIES: DUF4363 family protein [Thermincola]ADG81304.1 conserved hypothetical protein [Thermincola potens JR]KNZ68644.1 hypothetical protein Tfer_2819 [Thermincola ferriacetica]
MKTFVATLVVFAILVGFSTFTYNYINNTTDDLMAHIQVMEKHLRARNWQQAEQGFSKLKSSWDRTSSNWAVFIDHQELDSINMSMARLKNYMDTREKPELLAELGELKLLLKHIPEKEALNLKNIL